ncbi:hypothetical protein LCGC14_1205690, partial [marine sediment metagenome]
AIHKTTLQVQKGVRANLRKKFTIRKAGFADRSIKITQFAKKRFLEARIQVISPGPTPDVFSKHEVGGIKTARENRRVAIPQDILQNRQSRVTKAKRPAALIQRKRGFIITTKRGQDLLLQRKGRGRRSRTIIAYSLEDRVRIPATLGFFKTVQGVFRSQWPKNFAFELERAIRTIKR